MKGLRKIRLIAFLLSLTSCIFMFGVGFSTWYNVSVSSPVEQSVTVETYDVLSVYMRENDGMTIFNSSLLSFKTTDGTLADTDRGVITVNYVVPASTVAATDGSFTVDFLLGYSALASGNSDHRLFATAFGDDFPNNSFSVQVKLGDSTEYVLQDGDVSDLADDDSIFGSYDFTVENTEQDFEFTVIYTFDIPGGLNFKSSFGQYLNGSEGATDATKFSASAAVRDR